MVNKLIILQLIPLAGSLVAFFLPKQQGKPAGILALCVALLQLVFVVAVPAMAATSQTNLFGLSLVFNNDTLAAITLVVLSAATAIAVLYSLLAPQEQSYRPSFYGLILLVLAGTTGVALAANLIQFYIFWEMMLIPAWLLVMNWNEDKEKVNYISLKFFILTHIGAVLMLISILWLVSHGGTSDMNALKAFLNTLAPSTVTLLMILFFMGFIVKLAIFPFHTWLPDAYTSPVMPVTLVLVGLLTNIGIYGLIRFSGYFGSAFLSPLSTLFMAAGVITIFYGGIMALVEKSIKRILAYSSMSQMGYILFAAGTLMPMGMAGAEFNLFNQAATKLALFMAIGLLFAYSRTYDIDQLGGLAKKFPSLAVVSIAGMFSLVGAPPAMGFWPELFAFGAGFSSGKGWLTVLALAGSLISVGYGLRLIRYVFFGPEKIFPELPRPYRWTTYVPLFLCTLIIVLLGVYPGLVFEMIRQSVNEIGFIW